MVWRSASLRYEKGKKKLNEVDFISQEVELALDGMVVKKIEDGLLEEMKVSHFGKEVMILEWMSYAYILVLRTFLVVKRSLDGGVSKTLMVRMKMIMRIS
ncbi:hypothetical protein Tco_1003276 [Tanacetum coccineum]|uniref:Uncharacterized protein n=1 Tax=Tanacetum coccineum TaxID=301880 RepID=A0ABQ5F8M2_9ASTR